MPQKFIHDVSPELTKEAAFKSFANIESHALTAGTTIRFLPGTYEMGSITLDGINLEGLGARESVILCNTVATVANTVAIRNVTLSGNSPGAASTAASIYLTNSSNAQSNVTFEGVKFINGDFGVDSQGTSTLVFNRVDATGVDRFLRSNSVQSANVSFSLLNTSSNAYFTAANAQNKAIQVRSCYSGGSNTGTTVKTVSSNVA